MKTIQEHFLSLGPKLAKLAIKTCMDTHGVERLNEKTESSGDAINDGIHWSRTIEGSSFWDGVYSALKYGYESASSEDYMIGFNLGMKAKKNIDKSQL